MDAAQLKSQLESFLAARNYPAEVSGVEQIVGGFSQITYKFDARTGDAAETLVVRSDRPGGSTLTLTDRDLEYQVIKFLNDAGAPVPLVRWADRDGSELGTRSLISDFVAGRNLLQATRLGEWSSADAALVVAEAAAAIHSLDTSSVPQQIKRAGDWESYIDEQIQAWRDLEARQVERMPVVRYLAAWLDANRPEPTELTLVHGEFGIANLMVTEDGKFSVIDWEYAHVGDPRMDFGWCLQRGGQEPPNVLADNLAAACERYRELTGASEAVINPAAVSYFVILGSWRAFDHIVDGFSAMSSGASAPLLTAYLISPWSLSCAAWLQLTKDLDAMTQNSSQIEVSA
jgi:aminoglycoside phosphotransferase (APT) family kinase protein